MSAALINRFLLILAAVGVCVASVVTFAHYGNKVMPCGAGSACDALAMRPESKWFGIPVAAFGLVAYLVLFVLAALRAMAWPKFGPMASKVGFWISGVGFAISGFLVYSLLVQLQLKCDWCFASAATMTLTFIGHLLLMKAKAPEGEVPMTDVALTPLALVAAFAVAGTLISDKPDLPPTMNVDTSKLTFERLVPDPSYLSGNPEARLTIVEIADFYCPACRQMHQGLAQLRRDHPKTLAFAFRPLPLFQIPGHENSLAASLGAEYARVAGKYEEFQSVMWSEGADQGVRSPQAVADILDRIGLQGQQWFSMHQDPKQRMFQDLDQGLKLFEESGIRSTPTFVLYIDRKDPIVVDAIRLMRLLDSSPYKELLEGKR